MSNLTACKERAAIRSLPLSEQSFSLRGDLLRTDMPHTDNTRSQFRLISRDAPTTSAITPTSTREGRCDGEGGRGLAIPMFRF